MSDYRVIFPKPVTYLPGHSKEREVTELIVSAPDEQGALFHAIRVVQGDIGMPEVHPYQAFPAPPVIEFADVCMVCGIEKQEGHICAKS